MTNEKLNTVTRATLADSVGSAAQLSAVDANRFVEYLLEEISSSLKQNHEVMISGFGKFVVATQKARTGRNPRNGEPVLISERRVMRFRPSDTLKDALNRDVG